MTQSSPNPHVCHPPVRAQNPSSDSAWLSSEHVTEAGPIRIDQGFANAIMIGYCLSTGVKLKGLKSVVADGQLCQSMGMVCVRGTCKGAKTTAHR